MIWIHIEFCQHSVWSEMMEELRFAIRCYGSTKKPRLKRRCSQCTMHHDFQCAAATGPTPPAAVIDSSPNGVLHPPRQIRPIQSPNFVLSRDNEMHYRYHDVTDIYNDVLVDKNHVIGDKEANNTDGSNVRNDGRYNSKLTYYPQKWWHAGWITHRNEAGPWKIRDAGDMPDPAILIPA